MKLLNADTIAKLTEIRQITGVFTQNIDINKDGKLVFYSADGEEITFNMGFRFLKSSLSKHLKLFSNVGFHEVIYENNIGNDILFNRYKIIIDNLVVLSGEIDEKIIVIADNSITINISFNNNDMLPIFVLEIGSRNVTQFQNETLPINHLTISTKTYETLYQIPDVDYTIEEKYNIYNTDYNNSIRGNYIYSDIDMKGQFNPLSGDISLLKDGFSINQSLKNLLLTNSYERPFSSQFIAGDLHSILFDINDEISSKELRTMITTVINNYEPRIIVNDIKVNNYIEEYAIEVVINYIIKSTSESSTFRTTISKL